MDDIESFLSGDAVARSARVLEVEHLVHAWWPADGVPSVVILREVVAAARAVLDQDVPLDQAVTALRRPEVTDLHRLAAVLYIGSRPDGSAAELEPVVLRLAADSGADAEFCARCYLRLGELMGHDARYAANSFSAGFRKAAESGPVTLQAALLLRLARCAARLERWTDAVEHARLAKLLYERCEAVADAEAAALIAGTGLLELDEPVQAAELIRPVVIDRLARGTEAGDAATALRYAVRRAARSAFEPAAEGDPACVDVYDTAVALAAGTDCGVENEARDRRLLAWSLAVHGHPDAARRQQARADDLDDGAALALRLADGAKSLNDGDVEAARRQLRPVMAEAGRDLFPHIELAAAYALGECALVAGQYDEALDLLGSVADRSDKADPALHARTVNKIGTVYSAGLRRPETGLPLHEAAIEEQRRIEDRAGLVVSAVQAALACTALGRLDDAERHAAEVARLGPDHPPPDVEWVTGVPALVASLRGRWPEAKAAFRRTIAELERRRAGFTTADGQRRWAVHKADFYGQAIEAAIVAGDGREALGWLELARNRYFRTVVPEGPDDVVRQLREATTPGTAVVWCGAFPRGLGVVAARPGDGEPTLRCAFHLDLTASDLQGLFLGQAGKVVRAGTGGRAVDAIADAVLGAPGDIPFYGAYGRWQASGPEWADDLGRVVAALRARLWPRILDAVGDAVPRIVLLPSVGCSELPVAAAAPDRWPGGEPLGVSVAPSLAAPARRKPAGRPLFLLQAENPTEDDSIACCSVEAAVSRALFAGHNRALRGRRATKARVLAALGQADVFHFIGHAYCDWQEPLDSGLVCAGREGGALTVRDLLARPDRRTARLVVLSACQIGNVHPDKSNDFVNLPSALVAAGARSVLAPRWSVDDIAAAMLVSDVLTRCVRDGQPLSDALAAARRWLRDDVTTQVVAHWLTADVHNAEQLAAVRARFTRTYAPGERPFAGVVHWGAFEVTGHPDPLGAAR
ncbi:CHAT domain-containing protein [Amycolatopsis sp. lyj-109]|uniref:CHAT domain-containing protein n=1 Tax=Amycolatopsis sp. lyj-109 TaxID=2789287 RepID=UPI0039787262